MLAGLLLKVKPEKFSFSNSLLGGFNKRNRKVQLDGSIDKFFLFSVESVRSEDDEESEESEDEDIFVPKEFVEIREGDVQTYYCIEEEVGRYVSQLGKQSYNVLFRTCSVEA